MMKNVEMVDDILCYGNGSTVVEILDDGITLCSTWSDKTRDLAWFNRAA